MGFYRLRHFLIDILAIIFPWLKKPVIHTISPGDGWPGTIINITGKYFDAARDGNVVKISGEPALVIRASETELMIMAGEKTTAGKISITTSKGTGLSSGDFTILPYPKSDNPGVAGPPIFFHGPQYGTPATGVVDQRVLVMFTYPTDQNPGTPAQRAAERNAEIARFDQARQFWQQASYGSTSWLFDFTDWLALPNDRDFYCWQREDIGRALLILLKQTRRNIAVSGNRALAGNRTSGVSVLNITDPTAITESGSVATTDVVLGTAISGNLGYACSADGKIYVIDLAASPISIVRTISNPGRIYLELAVQGNLLVVASEARGIEIYTLGTPDNPTFVSNFALPLPWDASHFTWGLAVKLVGTTAWVGTENHLFAVDLSNAAAPTVASFTNNVGRVYGLDIEGNNCAAATDGSGIKVYDISAVPALRSSISTVNRVHSLSLSGNIIYAAGAGSGLSIYDITSNAAPAVRGTLATVPEAYACKFISNHACMLIGGRTFAMANVSDVNAPAMRDTIDIGPAAANPVLADVRAALDTAIGAQNLTQEGNAAWLHGLQAAVAAGHNLDLYEGLVLVIRGHFLRGQSGLGDQITYNGTTINFNHTKGLYYVATGAASGRIAHETGHWIGEWDIYQDWLADGTVVEGTAAPWCMAGNHDSMPLFCAHHIHEIMRFYRNTAPAADSNVETRTWTPSSGLLDETFDIVAHDVAQNADNSRVHVVKLVISSGLRYYIEVRQKAAANIFDQNIPFSDMPVQGSVLVTKVTEGASVSNTFERPIQVFGVLKVGEKVVDAARALTIEVVSIVQNSPLVYRVNVKWNQEIPADPNGTVDLTMTPWDTSTWETVDIWIDSPRNNSGATIIYENHVPGNPSAPIRNGDRPWVHRVNKIYARIRNTGAGPASDVYVSFYGTSPPGVGDNGNWSLIGTQVIPTISGYDPLTPGSGEVIISQPWTPGADQHTCIKVVIFPQPVEINTANNFAQENVFVFDSAGGSSHEPVVLDAMVRSPFSIWKKVDMLAKGLPYGWHVVIDHQWVWTGPYGEREVKAVIWTDLDAPYDFTPPELKKRIKQEGRTPKEALARIEGWTTFNDRYLPIGGILSNVKATKKVKITPELRTDGGYFTIRGCLKPAIADTPITVEITDSNGERQYLYSTTDGKGCFSINNYSKQNKQDGGLTKGDYKLQVFVTAGGEAAENESKVFYITVI